MGARSSLPACPRANYVGGPGLLENLRFLVPVNNQQIDWPAIEKDYEHAGEDVQFCFVSVYGFTPEARANVPHADPLIYRMGIPGVRRPKGTRRGPPKMA